MRSVRAALPARTWVADPRAIADALIQHHAGCIIAEQTAPYYDECLLDEAADRHEHHMLDLLARFDGEPIATDDGRLVYRHAGGRRPLPGAYLLNRVAGSQC